MISALFFWHESFSKMNYFLWAKNECSRSSLNVMSVSSHVTAVMWWWSYCGSQVRRIRRCSPVLHCSAVYCRDTVHRDTETAAPSTRGSSSHRCGPRTQQCRHTAMPSGCSRSHPSHTWNDPPSMWAGLRDNKNKTTMFTCYGTKANPHSSSREFHKNPSSGDIVLK